MREIVNGLWLLDGFPHELFNIYLAGDVLIDAGTRWARRRVLRQLEGRTVRMVALTHCHPDHHGAARAVCERFHVPLACHEADAPAAEGCEPMVPRNWNKWLEERIWCGPCCHVDRPLHDGDEVGGFRVIHTPGHTPGHVVFFRERDRVAVAGDLLENIHFVPGWPGLRESPALFTVDPAANRKAIRLLASLEPRVVCFGHGPPLRDPVQLRIFAEHLQ